MKNLKTSVTVMNVLFTIVLSLLLFISCKQEPAKKEVVIADYPVIDSPLQEIYANDFLIGSAINVSIVTGKDSASQNIILKEFNTITPENCMKAEEVNPQPGVYNFKAADDFVAFGKKNDMFIVGHTLIWHNQTPAWFFTDERGNQIHPTYKKKFFVVIFKR